MCDTVENFVMVDFEWSDMLKSFVPLVAEQRTVKGTLTSILSDWHITMYNLYGNNISFEEEWLSDTKFYYALRDDEVVRVVALTKQESGY